MWIVWLAVLAIVLYVLRAVTRSKVSGKSASMAQGGSAPVNTEVRACPAP